MAEPFNLLYFVSLASSPCAPVLSFVLPHRLACVLFPFFLVLPSLKNFSHCCSSEALCYLLCFFASDAVRQVNSWLEMPFSWTLCFCRAPRRRACCMPRGVKNLCSGGLNHRALKQRQLWASHLGCAEPRLRYLQPGLGLLPDLQQAPNHPAEFWVIAGMAVQAVDWEHLFCTLAGAAACAQGCSWWRGEARATSWP